MCGHTHVEGSTPIKKGTLYTRLGPVEVEYHDTLFSAGKCKLPFTFGAEQDPWCGSKPPILACDGTHIGISIRNMKLERPVTDTDLPEHKVIYIINMGYFSMYICSSISTSMGT